MRHASKLYKADQISSLLQSAISDRRSELFLTAIAILLMIPHFSAPENLPFAVTFGLMLAIGVFQIISLLIGLDLSSGIDAFFPDFDAHSGDLSLNASISGINQVFAWLNLGKVPVIITLIAFLFIFSFIGFNLQFAIATFGLNLLPPLVAAPISLIASIYPLKWSNILLSKLIPRDETMAVSRETFVGRVAIITIGTATHTRPAEAKIRGPLGRTHYIMVLADSEDLSFKQGDEVLLVSVRESVFSAIPVSNPNLKTH